MDGRIHRVFLNDGKEKSCLITKYDKYNTFGKKRNGRYRG